MGRRIEFNSEVVCLGSTKMSRPHVVIWSTLSAALVTSDHNSSAINDPLGVQSTKSYYCWCLMKDKVPSYRQPIGFRWHLEISHPALESWKLTQNIRTNNTNGPVTKSWPIPKPWNITVPVQTIFRRSEVRILHQWLGGILSMGYWT